MWFNPNWVLRTIVLGPPVRVIFPTRFVWVSGRMPTRQVIVVAGPHKTAKETFIVPAYLWLMEFSIMVKAEAFRGIFKPILMSFGLIPVERQGGRGKDSFPFARAALKKGKNLFFWPEATRHGNDDGVHEGKLGAIFLSFESGVPILPVAVIGMRGFLRRRYAIVGKPFDVRHELGLLGYAIDTPLEGVVARLVMERLMRYIAELALTEYVGNTKRGGKA
ncbi:MAG: 1-acylglycerol-3-phosphate O-acyltransferase [Candidatus Saccharibacteria bacterium]|nr:1-acylglycerol-3-phosphate O-acyltransferase [Candidatus Saccharibacteria bacterium]